MRWCEGKLKVKIAHFRLPSASQKRACLSSLLTKRIAASGDENIVRSRDAQCNTEESPYAERLDHSKIIHSGVHKVFLNIPLRLICFEGAREICRGKQLVEL